MVRVSSPAKLRPWSELTAKMVMGVVPGLVTNALHETMFLLQCQNQGSLRHCCVMCFITQGKTHTPSGSPHPQLNRAQETGATTRV